MTHEFIQLAEQIVNRKHFDLTTGQDVTFTTLSEAMDYLAWKKPALYEDYRRSVKEPMKMVEESTGDFVTMAEGYEITKDQFMNLAYAEQRRDQTISLPEAIERAAVRFPEMYNAYRYGVTK